MKTNKEWIKYLELMKSRPDQFVNSGILDIVTDEETVSRFEAQTGKKIGVIYESPYHILAVDLVREKEGRIFAYERVLPAVEKGAVVAVPVYDGKFVLLRQYRHALRREQYAFPRGFAEPGISPEENLKKELKEEINGVTDHISFLGHVIADSGFDSNSVSIFLCSLKSVEFQLDHEGIQEIILLTPEELRQWIKAGKIDDGFTLSALSLLSNCEQA